MEIVSIVYRIVFAFRKLIKMRYHYLMVILQLIISQTHDHAPVCVLPSKFITCFYLFIYSPDGQDDGGLKFNSENGNAGSWSSKMADVLLIHFLFSNLSHFSDDEQSINSLK